MSGDREDEELPRLHHLALGARDVEGLSRFYHEVLGLPEVARHQHEDGGLRSVWLGLGGGAVLMVEEADGERSTRNSGGREHGVFLLALRMPLEQRAELEKALGEAEERTEFTSYYRDPEGNRIAISGFEF